MSEKKKTYFVEGTCNWAKVLGKPPMDELAGIRKWSVDVFPKDVKAFAEHLKEDKVNKRLKDKGNGKYVTFTRNEKTRDGEDNKPIPVFDKDNNPWPENVLIGNGSTVVVRYRLNKNDKYGNIVWVEAIKVKEHVPYVGAGMFPEDDEDEFDVPKKAANKPRKDAEDDDFDDDVPF